MAEKPVQTGPRAKGGRRSAAVAAVLFPLLVSAGTFAPGWVQIALEGFGQTTSEAPPVVPASPFDHQPLPAPSEPAISFPPVAVELDRLFLETKIRGAEPAPDFDAALPVVSAPGPTPAEIAQLLSFPRHDTDPIVLDELAPPEQQVVFKDALIPEEVPDLQLLDQGRLFMPLCNSIPATNCIRFDDFTT